MGIAGSRFSHHLSSAEGSPQDTGIQEKAEAEAKRERDAKALAAKSKECKKTHHAMMEQMLHLNERHVSVFLLVTPVIPLGYTSWTLKTSWCEGPGVLPT